MTENDKPAQKTIPKVYHPKQKDLFRRGYQPQADDGQVIRPEDLTPPEGDMAIEPPPPPPKDDQQS